MRFPAIFIIPNLSRSHNAIKETSCIATHSIKAPMWFLATYWAFVVSNKLRAVPARYAKKQPAMCLRLGYVYPQSESEPPAAGSGDMLFSSYRHMNYRKEYVLLDGYPL